MERQSQKLIKPNGADDHINSSYLLTKFLPEGWGKKKKREEYETIKYGVCYITVVFFFILYYLWLWMWKKGERQRHKDKMYEKDNPDTRNIHTHICMHDAMEKQWQRHIKYLKVTIKYAR